MDNSLSAQEISQVFELQRSHSILLRRSSVKSRKEKLRKIKKWILENQLLIEEAVYSDFQKPKEEVDSCDIYPVLSEINHTLSEIDSWTKPTKVDAPITLIGTSSEIRYEAKGVCLIMSPWNFPFNLAIGPLVSCLAAGNTAIIKPSEITPATSSLVQQMIGDLFSPNEVSVFLGGPEIAAGLLKLPFDHIFFTGSPRIGKLVMKAAADHLSSVCLELGGKSPAIIHSDVNISDAARRIAFGKFVNNGQTCIAPDYLFVHRSVSDKFLSALIKETKRLFGDGLEIPDDAKFYGRISNLQHFERLHKIVEGALSNGWKSLLSGPNNTPSRFFHPTILLGENKELQLMEEEIFGPVLPVLLYDTIDEAIDYINSKPKPLALYVYSSSNRICNLVASNTSSGSICFNECLIQYMHPTLPFGGVNYSGFGKAHGKFGFMSFSNEKAVVSQKSGFATSYLFHPPYRSWFKPMMRALFRWF
jgi:aldehyde dehydrogenase (NAD+)